MGAITLVWDPYFLGWRIPGRDDVERDKEKANRIARIMSRIASNWERRQISDQTHSQILAPTLGYSTPKC